MKKIDIFCPIRDIISRFGDKWSILILLHISQNEVLRFNELNKLIPDISQKMLSSTLKSLESLNLVSRKIYPTVPPKVEYRLTELGRSLMPHVQNLIRWGFEHKDECMVKE